MDSAPTAVTRTTAAAPCAPGWDRWLQAITGQPAMAGSAARPNCSAIDRGVLVQAAKIALSAGAGVGAGAVVAELPVADLGADHRVADRPADGAGVDPGRASRRSSRSSSASRVAIWLGGLIGLHAWSIAVIVAVGFLIGKVLRLSGGAAAQIPINGLFVLALGRATGRAAVPGHADRGRASRWW